ncbi:MULTISPECIES: isopeptide-forming domain-containing fimbrial protein [unclassified Enterococcus]|uniref:isopeptide-forming domain-containing fimbrial protein n=1 Tax=unclassified Enterococcus TaxID=2608891 RepID=UPI001CE1E2C0|nr:MULTISPECIES: isopeptide-forming domain-containing fimbrial protein [unclassified Enterococcus]MCA5012179.1 isopeptide-forming domain-containing fimbrial protein [Enterococcus sp. S23]MCA5015430.1 isopeptide-forming domain-containing fimbrial protein [Enterococcus sp. S22(2020)]
MKIKHKGFYVGLLVLLVTVVGYVSFKGVSPLRAASDNYSLEHGDISSDNEKLLPVKLTINNPKDEELTFKATDLDTISYEDLVEGQTENDLSAIELVKFSEDSFTIKTKASKEPLIVQFFVRTFAGNKAKTGQISLANESGEVAKLSLDLPSIPEEKVVEQNYVAPRALSSLDVSTFAAPVNEKVVTLWSEFLSALTDPTVDKITLAADLTASSSASMVARPSLEIDGQGHEINFGTTTSYSITMPQASAGGSTLTVKDLKYTGNNTTSIFDASAANSNNWMINFENITTLTGASRALLTAANSVVTIRGTNVLNITRSSVMITAKEVYIQGTETERASVTVNDGSHFVSSSIANGKFLIENADITVEKVSSLFNVTGATSQFSIKNSKIVTTSIGNLIYGASIDITVNDSIFDIPSITNFIYGTLVNTTISNSKVNIPTNISGNFYRNNAANSSLVINEKSDINLTSTTTSDIIDASGVMSFIVDDSTFNANSVGQVFSNSAAGTDMIVQNKAQFTAYSRSNNVLKATAQVDITVKDEGTKLDVSGNSTQTAESGGIISIDAANSTLNVENKAYFKIHSLEPGSATPAVMIQSDGGSFNASGQSILDMISEGQSNPYAATVRFRLRGNMAFNVSGESQINLKKTTGGAPGIRMFGANNRILVSENSDFTVHNKGTGSPQAPGADNRGQGIIFYESSASGPHSFTLTDPGSRVKILADNGAGIDTWRPNTVSATEGTYFEVIGNTSSGAIFNTYGSRDLTFVLDKPMYYDFKNNGPGKALMSPGSSSTFQSIHSDVSLWVPKTGQANNGNDGNPFRSWTLVDYSLKGSNMLFDTSSDPTFNTGTDSFGTQGINRFSRMSGNNANPIVDEIRTPTNADKFIFGHVSIPEGKDGFRDAWTDEVHVELEVQLPNETTKHKIYGTTVQDGDTGKYSIHGEEARAGIFRADMSSLLPAGETFIPTGTKVNVVRAWRGSSDVPAPDDTTVHIGTPADVVHGDLWFTDTVTSLDVTPPTQAVVSSAVNNAAKQIKGTSDEDGAKVFVKVNGEWLKDSAGNAVTTTVAGGNWTIDLPSYIDKTAQVEVYLKDTTEITPLPSFVLPRTYTVEPDGVAGNLNEVATTYDSYTGYHDAVKGTTDDRFDPATLDTVADVIPDAPKLVKGVESSGGSTTSVGDILTYSLLVSNTKADSYDWTNVEISDVLAEGLTFDPTKHKVMIDNVEVGTDKYNYNETTRTLTIKVGDLSKPKPKSETDPTLIPKEVRVTFQVTVEQSAVDKDLKNTATAVGYSPQEDPFIVGPNDPNATLVPIDVTSNEVGLPGGPAFGILSFVSAPTALDFGIKTESLNGNTVAVNPDVVGDQLVVSDNRGNLQKWTMTATLLSPLSNGDAIFPDALHYVNGESDEVITGLAKPIFVHTNADVGEYNISEEEWVKKNNGFKIELAPGAVNKLGKYQATIQFSLEDTP